jgi:hypothetical protein
VVEVDSAQHLIAELQAVVVSKPASIGIHIYREAKELIRKQAKCGCC